MSQTLTLEIPDEVFKVLSEIAQQEGKTPAEMGAQWVALMAERIKNDPLEQFIGAFPSKVPGWADRHDAYLGEGLVNYAMNKFMRLPFQVSSPERRPQNSVVPQATQKAFEATDDPCSLVRVILGKLREQIVLVDEGRQTLSTVSRRERQQTAHAPCHCQHCGKCDCSTEARRPRCLG